MSTSKDGEAPIKNKGTESLINNKCIFLHMSKNAYTKYRRFLFMLSGLKRFTIIRALLKNGEMNVSQIVKKTGFEQSTVSHCLSQLASCQYVFSKPNGKEKIYSLNKDTIAPLLKVIDKHVEKYCPKCELCLK